MHRVIKDGPDGLWCGPAALALLTGLSVGAIDLMIRCARRNNGFPDWTEPVHGMNYTEMINALHSLGYYTEHLYTAPPAGPATLGQFARHFRGKIVVPVLLRLKGHFAVMEEGIYADSLFPGGLQVAFSPPQPRRKLIDAWWVFRFDSR